MTIRTAWVGLTLLLLIAACSSPPQPTPTTNPDSVVTTTSNSSTTSIPSTTQPEATSTTTTTTVVVTTTSAENPSPPTTSGEAPPPNNEAPQVEITSPAHLSSHQAEFIQEENRFGATVSLAATVSDPDSDPFTVEWFSSHEGFLGTGESLTVVLHTGQFDSAQPRITARATDKWGAVAESSVQIVVWIPSDT